MKQYLQYFKTICVHKWYVLLKGLKLNVPIWRLIMHDARKFYPYNFIMYANRFYKKVWDDESFDYAWLDHQNHCDHHWEYWIQRSDHKKRPLHTHLNCKCLKMPENAAREMVADWLAAAKVYANTDVTNFEDWEWYQDNYEYVRENLHIETRDLVDRLLLEYITNSRIT